VNLSIFLTTMPKSKENAEKQRWADDEEEEEVPVSWYLMHTRSIMIATVLFQFGLES